MKQDTQRLVVVGGVVLAGAAIAGILYALTKSTSPQPPQGSTSGALTQRDLTQLLADTAATMTGPDYDYDINFGDWVVRRDAKLAQTRLAAGSIARLTMYPAGRPDLARDFAVQITEAIPLSGFTIYKGRWVNAPGGLEADALVAFTSSDITSVVKSTPRS